MGDPFAEGSRRLSHNFAAVNLVHSRRVCRRNRSANGCPPYNCPLDDCPPCGCLHYI
ncbi:MAG: hypothetical protein LBK82_05670 [Planctomycetaceae bacterium]|nr:hypothetical protein [Planctomycetaceae bacterium]